jgi:hypothetical protein
MKTLQERLSVLPAGLEPLYKRMVGQIDTFYHTHAAQIFRMVESAVLPLPPLAMSFAGDNPRDALSEETTLSEIEIADRHLKVAKRLKARTAGLIEIIPLKRDAKENNPPNENDTSSKSSSKKEEEIPWEPSRVQYLHLTVKEFLRSDNVPTWLATQISETGANAHVDIVACCLRQFRATGSLLLYDYRNTTRDDYLSIAGGYCKTTHEGIIFMIMFHTLEAERVTKNSQLAYLEALDILIMAHKPQFPDGISGYDEYGNGIEELRQWHWTLDRYADWSEPYGWLSDFVAYLIAIGMTRSVIDKFNRGYVPATKPGRPLLLYATCSLAPDYAIGFLERDTIDPVMVEELLKRKCDPNQSFESFGAHDIRDRGLRSVWEAVLLKIYERFVRNWPHTRDVERYIYDLEQNQKAMHDLRLRWLKTIRLFLDYGADPGQFVIIYGSFPFGRRRRRRYPKSRISGFLIFNRVFADFDDPLVPAVRNFMASKGATEVEEDILIPDPIPDPEPTMPGSSEVKVVDLKSRLRHIPFIGKALAISRAEKSKKSANKQKRD